MFAPRVGVLDHASQSLGDAGAKEVAVVLAASSAEPILQVYLHANGIGSLGAEYLAAGLIGLAARSSCERLGRLCLHENCFGDRGVAALAEAVQRAELTGLMRLDLSSNGIGDSGAFSVCGMLEQASLPALEEVSLAANRIRWAGCEALILAGECSAGCPQLSQLNLRANHVKLEAVLDVLEGSHAAPP